MQGEGCSLLYRTVHLLGQETEPKELTVLEQGIRSMSGTEYNMIGITNPSKGSQTDALVFFDEKTKLSEKEAHDIIKPKMDEYIESVEYEDGHDSYEEINYHLVTPESFEKDWENQENKKKENWAKDKYRQLVNLNRVALVETRWA